MFIYGRSTAGKAFLPMFFTCNHGLIDRIGEELLFGSHADWRILWMQCIRSALLRVKVSTANRVRVAISCFHTSDPEHSRPKTFYSDAISCNLYCKSPFPASAADAAGIDGGESSIFDAWSGRLVMRTSMIDCIRQPSLADASVSCLDTNVSCQRSAVKRVTPPHRHQTVWSRLFVRFCWILYTTQRCRHFAGKIFQSPMSMNRTDRLTNYFII